MRAIYADGRPVGFVLTFDEPSEGYFLWRFMIAEGHQRRGIGRRAMQHVLEHWRELGITAARTSVVPSNTARLASTNRSASDSPATRTTTENS
jgi:diamine N-acetyltransferase